MAAGAPGGAIQAVYVFVEPQGGWVDMTTYNADLGSPDGYEIGTSLAMSGNTIVAGEVGTSKLQASYVFVKPSGGWAGSITPTATLTASDETRVDGFASSVAINGNTIVVGAPHHKDGMPGAAYVYVQPKTGWADMTQTAELSVPVDFNLALGQAVAAQGNLVLAGAPGDAIGHNKQQGAVFGYLEPSGGWKNSTSPNGAETASDGVAGELFGDAIAINGNTVVVGAPYYGQLQGAAYIFSLQ